MSDAFVMKNSVAGEFSVNDLAEKESPEWAKELKSLTVSTGLATVLTSERRKSPPLVFNDNSICEALQGSKRAHLCDPYCGKAVRRAFAAVEQGGEKRFAEYRCHAGLHCVAAPVTLEGGERQAIIGGRAFLSGEDYRLFIERLRAGDLRDLPLAETLANVIFAAPADLQKLAARLEEIAPPAAIGRATALRAVNATDDEISKPVRYAIADARAQETERDKERAESSAEPREDAEGTNARQENFADAIADILQPLVETYRIASLAWLVRRDDTFATLYATGKFLRRAPHVMLDPRDPRRVSLVAAISLTGSEPHARDEAFPLKVGKDVRGALVVEISFGESMDKMRRSIESFCEGAALPLELLRLRDELERRTRAVNQSLEFIERLNAVEPSEAYGMILQRFVELLRSERGSLQLYDENAKELAVKAAVGPRAEVRREARVRLGEGISGRVLSEARPLVVRDLAAAHIADAPKERAYKTRSFISYPIIAGGRKVGVLNITDKVGGGSYDESDLSLLDMAAPQIALALDRADWHQKATQFELLSITDPLTGLLNRRYLEERLTEEIERSKRHHYAMSFMMLDIDDFKLYNDQNGHLAGDEALRLTAQCLKGALRAADVAARYGGEEFCALLPQTTLVEAGVIAERVRRRISQTPFPHGGRQPFGHVSVSVGVASYSLRAETAEAIIVAADHALYAAKRRGKNRVQLAYESPNLSP